MNLKRAAVLGVVALSFCGSAQAGPASEDLAKCLVENTSSADRVSLIRWIFAAAAAHPAVGSIAKVPPQEMEKAHQQTAQLFTRLLTESCKDKARAAITADGPQTLGQSFQVLGQVAAGELFSSPEVAKQLSGLDKYIDANKLETIMKDAPAPAPPK